MDLIVENVRCFGGRHVAPLAPITVLVGENSSGKSTLVAMARLASDAMTRWNFMDFNEEPFRLGAFDDIVTTTNTGKTETFAIGYRFPPRTRDDRLLASVLPEDVEFLAVFTRRGAQPALKEWTVRSGPYSLTHKASMSRQTDEPVLEIAGPLTGVSFTL